MPYVVRAEGIDQVCGVGESTGGAAIGRAVENVLPVVLAAEAFG